MRKESRAMDSGWALEVMHKALVLIHQLNRHLI